MESASRRRTGRTIVVVLIAFVALAGVVFLVTGGALAELAGAEDNGAFAEVRIRPPQRLIFDTGVEPQDFEEYRQTHARLMKSFFVLQSAIRSPEIAKLELIRQQPQPIDWLEENLAVSSPGKEFLRVSLPGHKSAEAAAIVNAVVEAYMREVVGYEDSARRRRLVELQKIEAGVAREVERLRADIRRQREAMAVPPVPEVELLDLDLMRQEYTRLRLKRIELDASLSAEPNEARAEQDRLRDRLKNVQRQIDAFESEFRGLADGRIALSKGKIALDEIERQIASKEKILEQLREQIGKLTIELNAPIGIEKFRDAVPVE